MLTQCSVIAVWKGIEPYPPPRWILEEAGEHHVCYRLIRDLVIVYTVRQLRSSSWFVGLSYTDYYPKVIRIENNANPLGNQYLLVALCHRQSRL